MGRGTWLVTWVGIVAAFCSGLTFCSGNTQTALRGAQSEVIFSESGGAALTMNYCPGAGLGLHPIAIVITSSGPSDQTSINSLAQAGYDVFSLNNQSISVRADSAPLQVIERAIRYVRFHSRDWNGNARKVALIGLGDGAYLSALTGLADESGVMGSADSVDRESARVQAVVALFGVEEAAGSEVRERWRAMLISLLQEKEQEAALAQSSAVYVNPGQPRFLLLVGKDKTSAVLARSVALQGALKKVGLLCELLRVQDGSRDWPHALNSWLATILGAN